MATHTYYLVPLHERQKDFYGKAIVKELSDGSKVLQSYKTDVCKIDCDGKFIRLWDGYSATTARHIHEFRLQNGFRGISKKEWDALQVAF